MAISSEVTKKTYAGNGGSTNFNTVFTFDSNFEVTVSLVNDATGVVAPWVEGTQYTLIGALTQNAGNVAVVTSPTDYTPQVGETLVIEMIPQFTQPTSLPRGGTVSPKGTLEPMHDNRVRQSLRLKDLTKRAIVVPAVDVNNNLTLPKADFRKNKVLAFDNVGDVAVSTLDIAAIESGTVDAQASAAAAAVSETNAATSETNAANSENNAAGSAVAAAIAAAANLYSTIENKTADFSVVSTDDGTLFVVDTSGGNVIVTLPDIAGDVAEGFRVGCTKASAANTLTINPVGGDTINGIASFVMTADTEFITLIADENTPDNWLTFGASTIVAGDGLVKSGSTISVDLAVDSGLEFDSGKLKVSGGVPTGTITWFAAAAAPTDYLLCDGSEISRTTFADLFAVIGITYGDGDIFTTFNLPDLRGTFVRGVDDGTRALDPDSPRALGSEQAEDFLSHTHTAPATFTDSGASNSFDQASTSTATLTTNATGGDETRPVNIALNGIIKT